MFVKPWDKYVWTVKSDLWAGLLCLLTRCGCNDEGNRRGWELADKAGLDLRGLRIKAT